MIKLMAAALWISIATTVALLVSFQFSQAPEPAEEEAAATPLKGLDYVKSGVISVPLFEKGRVYGYFLARLVFTAESKKLAQLQLPAEALLADQVYSHLYANPDIDFSRRENLDLDAFRTGIRDGINARLGEELLHEVLVEQVDFLPKDEVGASSVHEG